MEFVRRADVASFIQCHVNAFEYFGGVPQRCLYDNAKVVILGRDQEGRAEWNRRMLDFSLRAGFEMRVCRPYRAQTKGKVESGVKYTPSASSTLRLLQGHGPKPGWTTRWTAPSGPS